jgi:hypothetical protein
MGIKSRWMLLVFGAGIVLAACSFSPSVSTSVGVVETTTTVTPVVTSTTTIPPTTTTLPPPVTTTTIDEVARAELIRRLDAITSLVPDLAGVTSYGWDPSHGAPYSYISYRRDGEIYSISAFESTTETNGYRLVLGSGVRVPDAVEVIDVGGHEVTLFSLQSGEDDPLRQYALAYDICGEYNVWGEAYASDPDQMLRDLADVLNRIDCG